MKLSAQTLQILKNFAQFNPHFRVLPDPTIAGTTIAATNGKDRSMYVTAEIDEDFTKTVTLFNLPMFLSVVNSMGAEHDITLNGTNLVVENPETKARVKLNYADPETLELPKDKKPNFPPFEVEFAVSKSQIASVLKFADILGCPHIRFRNDENNRLFMEAFNAQDSSVNTYVVELGDLFTDQQFEVTVQRDVMKLMDSDYDVKLSTKNLVQFHSSALRLTYYIACLTGHTKWTS